MMFYFVFLGESRCDEDGDIHATNEYFGADDEMWRRKL